MQVSLQSVMTVLSVAVSFLAFLVSFISWRMSRTKAIKEATDLIFQEWWSPKLKALRGYFRNEFLLVDRSKLVGTSLKEIEQRLPADAGRLNELCFFFDRVGWLCAAGLVNVNYVLPPMQHLLRRVWLATAPYVLIERDRADGRPYDPVYCFGFEWLYRRTCRWYARLPFVLWRIGVLPRVTGVPRAFRMWRQIKADERNFIASLAAPSSGRPHGGGMSGSRPNEPLQPTGFAGG